MPTSCRWAARQLYRQQKVANVTPVQGLEEFKLPRVLWAPLGLYRPPSLGCMVPPTG